MYEEEGDDGKRRYTVQQIADEFGVTRPTIYRALAPKERVLERTAASGGDRFVPASASHR
jgi:AcrR family transcriptional regulator